MTWMPWVPPTTPFWIYGLMAGGILGFTIARRQFLEMSDKTSPKFIRFSVLGALIGLTLGVTLDMARYWAHHN
jgi:hypothetical protein